MDLLREARGLIHRIGCGQVLGVPIDWLLHLGGAALIVFCLGRFMALWRAVGLTVALLIAKETFDIFAKTRAEYIRPPTLDLAADLAAGLSGIALGYCLARWRRYPLGGRSGRRSGHARRPRHARRRSGS